MAAKRKYKPEYLNCGFTYLVDKGIVKQQCVICNEVLSNESFNNNKLKRHLRIKHSKFSDKNREFFERKEQNLKTTSQFFQQTFYVQLEASNIGWGLAQ